MLRRVVENVLVAVMASAVTWTLSNPGDSAGTVDAVIDRSLSAVAYYGGPLDDWLWLLAAALVAAGMALQILSMAPQHPTASWEWSLSMPSLATTLLGVGVTLALTAKAIGLAEVASLWALPLITLVAWWAYRWVTRIRHRWNRMATGL